MENQENIIERKVNKQADKITEAFENIKSRDYAKIKSYLKTGKWPRYIVKKLIKKALERNYITIARMKTHDTKSENWYQHRIFLDYE